MAEMVDLPGCYKPTPDLFDKKGNLMARVCRELDEDWVRLRSEEYPRWTAFIEFNGDDDFCEEIDVDAVDEKWARKMVEADLINGYQPGGKIIEMLYRGSFGMYM